MYSSVQSSSKSKSISESFPIDCFTPPLIDDFTPFEVIIIEVLGWLYFSLILYPTDFFMFILPVIEIDGFIAVPKFLESFRSGYFFYIKGVLFIIDKDYFIGFLIDWLSIFRSIFML